MSEASRRTAALVSMIHRELTKPRGFKKRGATMNRYLPGDPYGAVHVLNVQASRANIGDRCEVFINLGADFLRAQPAGVYKEHVCPFRKRVGDVWPVEADVDASAEGLLAALVEEGDSFFGRFADAHDYLEDVDRQVKENGGDYSVIGNCGVPSRICEMWVCFGQPSKARAALEGTLRWFAAERPRADPGRVHAFARSLGLEPLNP